MPTATKDAETKFCTSEELKRQTLNGRQTLRPDSTTGITVLPAWMDAPEDEGALRRPRMRCIEFKRTERRRAVSCKEERAYWRYCHES